MPAGNAAPSGSTSRILRLDIVGTGVFLVALAIGVPLRTHRPAQILVVAASMVLFAIGIAASLWAYTSALERSRAEEVGVANLFLLTGPTAPSGVRRILTTLLVAQVLFAIAAASVGAAGLDKGKLNVLAFAVLVPVFGIGMNGSWAARYGSFGPRVAPESKRAKRKIE